MYLCSVNQDLFYVDEPDGGVSLRVPTPRTSPRQPEPILQLPLDEDDYLQPKSSNPKAYLELENNKGKV